ncbi:uncharacterized protein RCH25_006704 [Pelodytes ibericus]
MRVIRECNDFIVSNFTIIGKLILISLLFGLEAFLDTLFDCPGTYTVAIVYSCAFLILPVVMLSCLSVMFRRKHSRNIFSRKCFCIKYFLVAALEIGEVPLLWILVLLIDGKYLYCFVSSAFYYSELYYFRRYSQLIKPICVNNINLQLLLLQVAGLCGLTLYVVLAFYVTRSNRRTTIASYWHHKQQENRLLQDIECLLENKAEDKRKTFVEELVSKDLDKINPKDGDAQEKLVALVREYKTIVKKLMSESRDVKVAESDAQESDYRGPEPTSQPLKSSP